MLQKNASGNFDDNTTTNNFIDLQAYCSRDICEKWFSWPFDLYNLLADTISMSIYHIFITTP